LSFLYSIFVDPFVQMIGAPDLLVQTLWEGLVGGVLYALIALGFVLIFKASGVFNFAQGIMMVFAALTLVGLMRRVCLPSSRLPSRSSSWARSLLPSSA
jgi:branched-chain amino acid transport system permease protein